MNRTLRIRQTDRDIFEDIRTGRKSVETRAATKNYVNLKEGDTLTFVCGTKRCVKRIRKVYRWPSVAAMAKAVPFASVMPRARTLEEAKEAYASWPGYLDKIREHGLVGFELAQC